MNASVECGDSGVVESSMSTDDSLITILLDDSHAWLSAIDRTVLGSFAVNNFEYLVMLQAWKRAQYYLSDNGDFVMNAAFDVLTDYITKYQESKNGGLPLLETLDEIIFWWSVSNDEALSNYRENAKYSNRRRRYEAIYEAPVRLPYFEAGLQDIAIIDKFIADGVDSHIAIAL